MSVILSLQTAHSSSRINTSEMKNRDICALDIIWSAVLLWDQVFP